MKPIYSIATEDKTLFDKWCALAAVTPAAQTPPPVAAAPPPAPPAPTPPPAPAPVAPPPAATAPVVQHGPAPEGWTIEHIQHEAKQLAGRKSPAAFKAVMDAWGAAKLSDIDPARWPEFYTALQNG